MTVVFVTATGTEIGKTYVSRGVIKALRAKGRTVEVLKPLQSGYDPREAEGSDAGLLLAAAGLPNNDAAIATIAPFRFAAPLSPHIAARREGKQIDGDAVIAFCRQRIAARKDALVIEGAGGVMAPLDDGRTLLDLIVAIGTPIILVTGSYLGTLSHTFTAVDAVRRREVPIAGIVVSETSGTVMPLGETAQILRGFLPATAIFTLPRRPDKEPDDPIFAELTAKL